MNTNTSNNNSKMEIDNIKKVQAILTNAELTGFASALKRLKMQLDQFGTYLANCESQITKAEQEKTKKEQAEEQKAQEKPANAAPSTKIRKFDNADATKKCKSKAKLSKQTKPCRQKANVSKTN